MCVLGFPGGGTQAGDQKEVPPGFIGVCFQLKYLVLITIATMPRFVLAIVYGVDGLRSNPFCLAAESALSAVAPFSAAAKGPIFLGGSCDDLASSEFGVLCFFETDYSSKGNLR